MAIGPPSPGDPFATFAVSDPGWGTATVFPSVGRLTLFRAAPAGVAGLGPACRGTLAAEPQLGLTARQASTRLHVSGAPPGALAFLLLGVSSTTWAGTPLPLSLESLGFIGCHLATSVELPLGAPTGVAGLAAGYAFYDLPVPVGSALGVTLHGQWLVVGSGATLPGALTDALSWRH